YPGHRAPAEEPGDRAGPGGLSFHASGLRSSRRGWPAAPAAERPPLFCDRAAAQSARNGAAAGSTRPKRPGSNGAGSMAVVRPAIISAATDPIPPDSATPEPQQPPATISPSIPGTGPSRILPSG